MKLRLVRSWRFSRMFFAAGLAVAMPVQAQLVTGGVRDVSGAVPNSLITLTLVDAAGTVVARARPDSTGRYSLVSTRSGRFIVIARAIGFIPSVRETLVPESGQINLDLELAPLPTRLPDVRISDPGSCSRYHEQSSETLALWELARAFLLSASKAEQPGQVRYQVIRMVGRAAFDGGRISIDSAAAQQTFGLRSFATTPISVLLREGFVRPRADGTVVFDAPSAELLVSDEFAASHCFSVLRSAERGVERIGLQFRPAVESDSTEGIYGRIWLDSATGQLRELDYGYMNLRAYQKDLCDNRIGLCNSIGTGSGAGGTLRFGALQSGGLFVREWEVRTPPEEAPYRPVPGGVRITRSGSESCSRGPGCRTMLIPTREHALTRGIVVSARDSAGIQYESPDFEALLRRLEQLQVGRKKVGGLDLIVADGAGAPIGAAEVRIVSPSRARFTSAGGRAEFRGLPVGEVTIAVAGATKGGPIGFKVTVLADSVRLIRVSLPD